MTLRNQTAVVLFAAITLSGTRHSLAEEAYNPLAIAENPAPQTLDLTVHDEARKRDIPLRVYLPANEAAAPVVLFSHGLGGSREGSKFLGEHWARRGYVAVFTQHPGSDTAVWRDKPLGDRMKALRQAADPQNFMLRVQDIPAVLNQLDRWNTADDHALAGSLDMKHIGMSGHSFGAVTTQAVSGQSFPLGGAALTEPRITAAIAFSPSTPRRAVNPKDAFGKVQIPWLLMTGTKDTAPIGDQTVESRLAVFPALPPGNKYELVLDGAEHSAFTDRALPGDRAARNPNHHRAILAISTAFWDAYLGNNAAAKKWLDGNGPRSVLEENDRWQSK